MCKAPSCERYSSYQTQCLYDKEKKRWIPMNETETETKKNDDALYMGEEHGENKEEAQ